MVTVFIDHHAGQLVGLAKAQPAGVVFQVQHRLAPGNCHAQPRSQQFQPGRLANRLARHHSQCNLRRRAVKSRAQQQAAIVGHRQQRGRLALGQLHGFKV